jgi:hypothetical protein
MPHGTMDQYQKIIASALLIILGGTFGFLLGRSAAPGTLPRIAAFSPSARDATAPEAHAVTSGTNAVAVSDQPPGSMVTVASATFSQNGWVVIHEERDGAPGAILGARRFDGGENQSGTVELLRPTQEGRVYFAMLHADDGDRSFDHAKDLPLKDPQGNLILMRFVTAARPGQP